MNSLNRSFSGLSVFQKKSVDQPSPPREAQTCTICCDESAELTFHCPTRNCDYAMCSDCISEALKDPSGANSKQCPLCKHKIARLLIESLCGPAVIHHVENEVRSRIEYETKRDIDRLAASKRDMNEMKKQASKIFRELCERVNTKCPSCKTVFHDYDGCNALTCGACHVKFCGVCLRSFGSNNSAVHDCARSHGNLFDKTLFENAKAERTQAALSKLDDEAHEIRELVKIECEKAGLLGNKAPSMRGRGMSTSQFLQNARQSLTETMNNDRLSVLSERDSLRGVRISPEDISPRSSIPDGFDLSLQLLEDNVYRIRLNRLTENGLWVGMSLPEDGNNEKELVPDILYNLCRSLRSCVVAIPDGLFQTTRARTGKDRKLADDEVCITFHRVDAHGGVTEAPSRVLPPISVLGLNENSRLCFLAEHAAKPDDELLFEPLRHFIGAAIPRRLYSTEDVNTAVGTTFAELNAEQREVASPLSVRTAMEVAGPPGSGKTKTIIELIRSIVRCGIHDAVILSERNGAIDAIADKFASECLSVRGKDIEVTDITLWKRVLAFGSSSMGPATKLFTHEAKMKHHPGIREQVRICECRRSTCQRHFHFMIDLMEERLAPLDAILHEDAASWVIAENIRKSVGSVPTSARALLSFVASTKDTVGNVIRRGRNEFQSSDLQNLIDRSDGVFEHLFVNERHGRAFSKSYLSESFLVCQRLEKFLSSMMNSPAFSETTVLELDRKFASAEKDLHDLRHQVQKELVADANVMLATIGSSHKLIGTVAINHENDFDGDVPSYASVNDVRSVVLVFDEAGCIPAFELLGISRLDRQIDGLVCVGDKYQLPPFNPGEQHKTRRDRYGSKSSKLHSLLDVSGLQDGSGRVMLTNQYRVPRDIAETLDRHIYKGNYKTPSTASVPVRGFYLYNVEGSADNHRLGHRKKYVNDNEIEATRQILHQLHSTKSVLVLTPYKKQQRQMQFDFKGKFNDDLSVLTIDQCQGQEADHVILSLVNKPTRFLTLNRLNVALSRTRRKLYVLCDRRQFEAACRDKKWEGHRLGMAMLAMDRGDQYDVDFDDYF